MNREKLISREFKLVLKTENFAGIEPSLIKEARNFWTNCKKIMKPVANLLHDDHNKITNQREIQFYDTAALTLHNNKYILRARRHIADNEEEVTLKFRHPDRYISQDRDMLSRKIGKGETKFEEDIKAPFLNLYSFSSNQPVEYGQELKKLKQVFKLYPGLKSQLSNTTGEEKMVLVNKQPIRELVITGPVIIINDDAEIEAECALIVWYDMSTLRSDPLIVEFSFRYGNKKEKYDQATAQKSYDVFMVIQQEMKDWIDDKNATKTGFVYDDK